MSAARVNGAPQDALCGPVSRAAPEGPDCPLSELPAGERVARRLVRLAALCGQAAHVLRALAQDLQDVRSGLAESRQARLMDGADQPPMAAPHSSPGTLLTADDVARLLNVSARTVRSWRRSGRLPRPLTIGATIRWRPEAIEAWLREQEDAA